MKVKKKMHAGESFVPLGATLSDARNMKIDKCFCDECIGSR